MSKHLENPIEDNNIVFKKELILHEKKKKILSKIHGFKWSILYNFLKLCCSSIIILKIIIILVPYFVCP